MWYPCLSYICLGFSGSILHIHALFISWPFRPRAIEQKCPIFTETIFAMVWCSVDGEWTVSTVLALSGGVAWPRPQTGHRHRHINIPRVRHCETLWHCDIVRHCDRDKCRLQTIRGQLTSVATLYAPTNPDYSPGPSNREGEAGRQVMDVVFRFTQCPIKSIWIWFWN